MNYRIFSCVALPLLAMGCSGKATEPTTNNNNTSLTVATSVTVGNGYYHNRAVSHFDTGSVIASVSEKGAQKIKGRYGTFSVRESNGAAFAIPNHFAPIPNNFILDATAHEKAVSQYFLSCGLPASQILRVRSTFQSSGKGGPTTSSQGQPDHLDRIYSILMRQVDGFPVPDSHAWATMTADGRVFAEEVHWPAIPESVITDAHALAEKMKGGTAMGSLAAKLGTAPADGQVVIHHTPSSLSTSETEYVATYDVPGKAVRHFDINQNEVRTIGERVDNGPSDPRPSPAD